MGLHNNEGLSGDRLIEYLKDKLGIKDKTGMLTEAEWDKAVAEGQIKDSSGLGDPSIKDLSGDVSGRDKTLTPNTMASEGGSLDPGNKNVNGLPDPSKATFAGTGGGKTPEESNDQIKAFTDSDGKMPEFEDFRKGLSDTQAMKVLYDLTGRNGNKATMEEDLRTQYNIARRMYDSNRR